MNFIDTTASLMIAKAPLTDIAQQAIATDDAEMPRRRNRASLLWPCHQQYREAALRRQSSHRHAALSSTRRLASMLELRKIVTSCAWCE